MPWINDLKIRGNWGRLGNSSIGDWDYIGTINQSIVTVFGGAIVPGSTQVKLVNAGLVCATRASSLHLVGKTRFQALSTALY